MQVKSGVNFTPQELEEIKNKLLKRKQDLIQDIRTKYSDAYNWMVSRNISLDNLQQYSKNIAAALTLTGHLISNNPPLPVPTPPPQKPEEQKDLLSKNRTQEDKIKEVWDLYGDLIRQSAQKYDVDEQLILATIMAESEGNQFAYRAEPRINDASYGLGQILYSTARGLDFTGVPEDLYKPDVNIDLIAKYHRRTIDTYGLLTPDKLALVYNTGRLFAYGYPGYLDKFYKWYDLTDQVYI